MFHITLHPHIEYISEFIRKYGYWEKIETEILYEIFKANKNILFIDIGSNLGYFSLLAASLGINTISFEPVRRLLLEGLNTDIDNSQINLNTSYLTNIDLFKPLNVFKEEYDKADRNYQINFVFIKL